MLDDAAGAAVKKKRDGNVACICLIHLLDEMWQERVFVSFNQSPLIPCSRYILSEIICLSWNDIPNSSTGVVTSPT